MNWRRTTLFAGGVLTIAGLAVAGTVDVVTVDFAGTNVTSTAVDSQLTEVDAFNLQSPAGERFWRRDLWLDENEIERLVHLDLMALHTQQPTTRWAESCVTQADIEAGQTRFAPDVQRVLGANYLVQQSNETAWDMMGAPGSPARYNYNALRSVKSGVPISVPPELSLAREVKILELGGRKDSNDSDPTLTVTMSFENPGTAATTTRQVVITIPTRSVTSRTASGGANNTIRWDREGVTNFTIRNNADNLSCPNNPAQNGADEITFQNPIYTDAVALAGFELRSIQFDYPSLTRSDTDPLDPNGDPNQHLGGPVALSLVVDASDYDAMYRYSGLAETPESGAFTIKANGNADYAWWHQIDWAVTWPNDDIDGVGRSDVFLTLYCGEKTLGQPDFTNAAPINITPSGLRALGNGGTLELDGDACGGEYAKIEAEIIGAFDTSPIITQLDLHFDIDADIDGFTREGFYDSVLGQTNAVADPSLIDCNDADAGVDGRVAYYADLDGDGDGAGAVAGFTCTLAANQSFNADDCKDTGPDAEDYNVNGTHGTETTGAGLDFNCDGTVPCYADADRDGDGHLSQVQNKTGVVGGGGPTTCDDRLGTPPVSSDNLDCNDANAGFNSENDANTRLAESPAVGADFDCNTFTDCYLDSDDDGFGTTLTPTSTVTAGGTIVCDNVANRSDTGGDCNDTPGDPSPAVFTNGERYFPGSNFETPGGGIDYNCSSSVECYKDDDGDDDGDAADPLQVVAITNGGGTSTTCLTNGHSDNDDDCRDNGPQAAGFTALNRQNTRLTETAGLGSDYDCSGTTPCFEDLDRDTWGTGTVSVALTPGTVTLSCASPANNRAAQTGDCNDTPGVVPTPDLGELYNPGILNEPVGQGDDFNCSGTVVCYEDLDEDGYGTANLVTLQSGGLFLDCDRAAAINTPGVASPSGRGTASLTDDCRDNDPTYLPNAGLENNGEGVDRDCDGEVPCYADNDRDGEGSSTVISVDAGSDGATISCDRDAQGLPDPSASTTGDCVDNNAAINTGATETVGVPTDFNCDRDFTCWPDVDRDGYGDDDPLATPVNVLNSVAPGGTGTCDNAAGGYANDDDDCDDTTNLTFPGANEPTGTEVDRNCNSTVRCFADSDGDGWGRAAQTVQTTVPAGGAATCASFGGATVSGDCNDTADPLDQYNPGSLLEQPGGSFGGVEQDFDCDGTVHCFLDDDRDGYGDSGGALNPQTNVTPGATYVCQRNQDQSANDDDCDDADDDFFPGAPETLAAGLDNNCDGDITCYVDADDDGYGSDYTFVVPGLIAPGSRLDCDDYGSSNSDDCVDCFTWDAQNAECDDNPAQQLAARNTTPNPLAVELLDPFQADENCDGVVACWPDTDRDGYGDEATDPANPTTWVTSNPVNEPVVDGVGQCLTSQGHADDGLDCHDVGDTGGKFYPGAQHLVSTTTYQRIGDVVGPAGPGQIILTEIPGNAFDDNCDGNTLCFFDGDRDGYGVETPLSTNPLDFKGWSGTRQATPGQAGVFDRMRGGQYTCSATRNEAPLRPGPEWDCNDSAADVYPDAPEADGVGNDNDCDAQVFCFIDNDGDGFGGSTQPTPVPQAGYLATLQGAVCTTQNGFADNGDDCHDNNQFAYPRPGIPYEVAGHTPLEGERYDVPGVGNREVGNGPGQFDYCGDGSETCYGRAFDDDCDGVYLCFEDEDGDGWGTDEVADPYPVGVGANPSLTCIVPNGPVAGRRAAVGGNALSDPDRDCHPLVADANPGVTSETTGNAYDDDCDDQIACFRDLDDDDYGIAVADFVTWTGAPDAGTPGYDPASNTFDCDAIDDMAAQRPAFDCHDNYTLANPGILTEAAGHTPLVGDTVNVPGVGPVVVGTGVGQYDLCGDGSTACYGVAMDENCDDFVDCFVDADGDGVGARRTTNEGGILPGDTRPWNAVVGAPRPSPYQVFTCVTTSGAAIDANRRTAWGGGVGQPGHDCNDGNSTVRPTVQAGAQLIQEGEEAAGHTINPSNPAQQLAFDEDCDGDVLCYEDLDQDSYGTREVLLSAVGGDLQDVTAVGTNNKVYNCDFLPGGTRSFTTWRGGQRGDPDFDRTRYDCHDNNPDAHPGRSESAGRSVDPLNGGFVAFDEDCDAQFTCYRDRDDDGVGTETFNVARTSVLAGRTQLPNGSLYDDGVYSCELAVGDLSWAVGVEQSNLTGRGGAVGGNDWDCHDRNANAHPDVVQDDAGDSLDSTGDDTHSWDDDCDGLVQCFRNNDGDLYGTFLVDLTPGAANNNAAGTITKVAGQDYYECDNAAQRWAGRGGPNPGDVNFDCHDDTNTAYPAGAGTHYQLNVPEIAGDAYDNDCNGSVDCFEDRDNDGYGTQVVAKQPSFFASVTSPLYTPNPRTAAQSGMVLYLCGLEAAQGAGLTPSPGDVAAWNLTTDRTAALGHVRGHPLFNEDHFDCHDDNPAANPAAAETVGQDIDPLSGDIVAFDDDCDGFFSCWRDRDNDTIGTATRVDVPRTAFNNGQPDRQAGGSTSDDGVYHCDLAPPSFGAAANRTYNIGGGETHLSGIGGGQWGDPTFDCHDLNAFASPMVAGEEPGDSLDSEGVDSRSYDDDCDRKVECFRDLDGDGYGTYTIELDVDLVAPFVNSDAAGTIALDGVNPWFNCENGSQDWARLGGPGTDEFDCHDDYAGAFRQFPDGANEIEGDAYDNDCDGFVNCFEDLDKDGFGTSLKPITVLTGGVNSEFAAYDPAEQPNRALAGMLLFPCGEDAARAAGLTISPTLEQQLRDDRRAEVGGVPGGAEYDCHDDWASSNPGQVAEIPGDPFDNDCNGTIRCYQDGDGDGFGFTTTTNLISVSTLVAQHLGGVLPQAAFLFEQFPFDDPRGTSPNNTLPAYPSQAFTYPVQFAGVDYANIDDYRDDVVEVAAREQAETRTWYDCRAVAGASPAGGSGTFLDCHDDEPDAHPGFRVVAGSVVTIAPEARRAVSGPFDPTCDGPIMCVTGTGLGVQVYDRLLDDRETAEDECVLGDATQGRPGGSWRCFEDQGVAYVAGRPSDPGEIAGDAFDNDCDGVVLCYDDADRDDVGTMPKLDDGTIYPSPLGGGDRFACVDGAEAEFTGDCHDNVAAIKPPVNLANIPADEKGADVSKLPYWSAALAPAATGWDDPACSGVNQVVLCHQPSDDATFDRYVVGDCPAEVPGGTYRCYTETVGDRLDQNCDGAVGCWYDGDGDGYGVEEVKVADPNVLEPIGAPTPTADPGLFLCANPPFLTAATRTGPDQLVDFDCNDGNFFENPGGIEPTADVFVGIAAQDRARAFQAIGNNIDENCDGVVQCWRDLDDDGFGGGILDGAPADLANMGPADLEAAWDGDGHLQWFIVPSPDAAPGPYSCDHPNMSTIIGDCHDNNANANPTAPSQPGDDFDNDCDGDWTCYQDLDGDGFGSALVVPDQTPRPYAAPRTNVCTTDQGEANDDDDCLDDNRLTANPSYPTGQSYPIDDFGGLDLDLDPADYKTVAFLSKPGGFEVYGDGFDEDCDGAELCFVDRDFDGFVDGTFQPGVGQDPLNRIGFVLPVPGTTGVIPCVGTVLYEDAPTPVAPWPLEDIIAGSADPLVDPFIDPFTGDALFDCNDVDPEIKPSATEIWYDGVDQDCDNRSDFDVDQDGYDSRAATAGRAPCQQPANRRWAEDRVIGCGIGTDCDDTANGSTRHPAPYDRSLDADAMAQVQYGPNDPPTAGPVTRYPEYDPSNPLQAEVTGIKGAPESCESGPDDDDDCDGNVNTSWDCWFDIWTYESQKLLAWDAAAQRQLPRGAMPRELFTSCLQDFQNGNYFVDRSDPLDYTPTELQDPTILAEAEARYNDFDYDPTWTPPANALGTRYYRDDDNDGEGDGLNQGVILCDVGAEEDVVDWLTNAYDCDDDNPTINRTGLEICDRLDNNCNGQLDEYTAELTPDLSPTCQWHYMDGDRDSWGLEDSEATGSEKYCLCPAFEAIEINPLTALVVDKEPPQVCHHWLRQGDNWVRLTGHEIGGTCYVQNSEDCDDGNSSIKPFEPGTQPYEIFDGVDNDCDEFLPVVELDCDDDNAFPYLPTMTDALVARPTEEPVFTALEIGLQPCGGDPPDVTCWGETLPVFCDPLGDPANPTGTGFWRAAVETLEELGKVKGASRVARGNGEVLAWDCDDQCASRRDGLTERCDGIDNDCNQFADEAQGLVEAGLIDVDLDGVPDPMQRDLPALGKVQPGELDLDGDNHVSCAAGTQGRDNQTATTDRSCREYEQFLDCNDLCVLSAPAGPEEESCNGFVEPDLCVEPGESDGDGDGYRSCGTFGTDPGAGEKIYALLYTKGDIPAYLDKPDINKLEDVVPLIPPRRYGVDNGVATDDDPYAETDLVGELRECDAELADRLSTVLPVELPTRPAEVRDAMLSVCVRADTCRELAARAAANSGLEEANDDLDDIIPAPAAPPTGINVLPEYCAELEDVRCSVVELTLNNSSDDAIYAEADKWREALDPSDPRAAHACVYDEDLVDLHKPEQAITRTVWSRDQIVAARKLVVDYECFRMYGTFGCDPKASEGGIPGDESWSSPWEGQRTQSEGYFRLPDVPIGVVDDHPEWWMYLNRFSPRTVDGGGTLVGCWGDPRTTARFTDGAATIEAVGGDCKSTQEDKENFDPTTAHRGAAEGPGDMIARYLGENIDCSTCLDGVDNNCDGSIDAEDPGCSVCFVGQGYGCGCSAAPNVGTLGRTSTPMVVLVGLLTALARRRKRT